MSMNAYIHTKHIVEYGDEYFTSTNTEVIKSWLNDNGVSVYRTWNDDTEEWEIDKLELKSIPESAYEEIMCGEYCEISGEELRKFVKELLDAPTGCYAYISWF